MQHFKRVARSSARRPLLALAVSVAAAAGSASQAQEAEPVSPPALAAQPTDLPEVLVYMKEGNRISGLLVSADTKQVVVRVTGIDTRLSVGEIDRYEVLAPILERYQELRKSVGDNPEGIVRLARWLQDREQYPLALSEVNRALELDKTHAEALRMKAILEQLIVLKHTPRTKAPGRPQPQAANPARPRPGEFPLLTAADINIMRVYEVDLAAKPRLVIPRDTATRMLDAHAGHPLVPHTREGREALARKPAVEILDLMFKLRAREFYKEVEVLDPPASIKLFRDNVQRTWLMGCATNQCHGGLEAGRLVLFNHSPNSDASVYTNLLILQRFRTGIGDDAADPTASGPRGRSLIDWDQPERSPLLQLGLPREDSLFRHPKVPRADVSGGGAALADIWKPEFRSTEDKLYKKAVEWIRSMYRPRPEYPVVYTPIRPFEPPAPAPTPPKPEKAVAPLDPSAPVAR